MKALKGLLGGGGDKPKQQASGGEAQAAAAKKLFAPEQIQKITKDYGAQGGAKWNQVFANSGMGAGTGGDFNSAIQSQADTLGSKIGELTDQSGYGGDGMGQLQNILKGVEGGIGAKYPVY